MKYNEINLTKGPITRSLILFSIPMILGNLLQQLYNIVDTLIVGRTIGATALSAVGSSYALMTLLTSIILGLCMGSGVVFAQYYGANENKKLLNSIYNAFVFIMLATVLLNVMAYLLLPSIIKWLNIPYKAIDMTRDYLLVIFSGILFVSIYNFFCAILRSLGNTFIPLVILAISAITNIILDLIFIILFSMGVKGAALATVISQIISALFITLYFFRNMKGYWPDKKNRVFNKEIVGLILNNSILTAIQQSIMNFGILMVQGLVNSFGYITSAAFAVGVKIDAFAYMPAQDFGNAFATYVAQNYGAQNKERIEKGYHTALFISSLFCIFVAFIVNLFASSLMKIFITKPSVIQIGVEYLHIEGTFYIGIGILFLLYALYRGLGKPFMSIVLTVISLGLRVLLAYVLSSYIGQIGIWWAVPIGWAMADLFGIIYFMIKKKKLYAF